MTTPTGNRPYADLTDEYLLFISKQMDDALGHQIDRLRKTDPAFDATLTRSIEYDREKERRGLQ